MNLTRRTAFVTVLALGAALAHADEGMWMPKQLPQIAARLKATGLELDPASLTQLTEFPMGAVISLGNCTASFVSPQGLAVTNHHCAYGSIQYNSAAGRNLIHDGFLAATLADELPAAPGSRIYVTVQVDEVTGQILDAKTAKLGGQARTKAMEANEKRLVAACEQDAGHRCNVHSFYGGLEYYLIKQLEVRDVRLVYAPPQGVGNFGGETDNWMWPRHTGDFSFYRAYVGKDGKPADFHKDNVPYQPKHVLKIARAPLAEGDFTMIAGYPGRTNRHRLPSEVEFTFGWSYPAFVKASGEQLAIIERETKGDEGAAIKYASSVRTIANYYKNRQGMLDSYASSDFLARKQRMLADLKAWIAADPARRKAHGADVATAERLIAERDAIAKREFLLAYSTPRLLNAARQLNRLAHERAKPDAERKAGYQERDLQRIRESLEAIDKRYLRKVDQALAQNFLLQYLALPPAQHNRAFLAALGMKPGMDAAAVGAALDALYAGSKLDDKATRLAWIGKAPAEFAASDDAFIRAAVALFADDRAREDRDEKLGGDAQRAYSGYMKALIAWKSSKGEPVYPDANSTLRVTFGKVASRSAGLADGSAWTAFTTLRGVKAKATGKGEFEAPAAQLKAIDERRFDRFADPALDSVPVNFLATLDITGGNSGSPVLNARAELVGLAFDGTLDAVISDWDFNVANTRTIAVDSRYMLWQMKVVDGATRLLAEMGVE